ncbi:DUF134 domain-containing protein [Myxococcota bacterium]|nr:DUF134 domain-containing protein [Myxococcota bacterium]MBU1382437.1 DUF134 domain-containing protein [Myxococcota bacterium]MBU1498495.1 DUF134 domain-containing protein [Myxococcota bacterium]
MARPTICRKVGSTPKGNYFKPQGIPLKQLKEIVISIDEFEAIRLADYEGLYQDDAAVRMNISRQTFGRIVNIARQKVACALVNGCALKIEGGNVSIESTTDGPPCQCEKPAPEPV